MIYILIGLILGVLIYYKIIKPTKFWEERNVTCVPAKPLIGNMVSAFTGKKHGSDIVKDIYNKFPEHRYVGFLQFNRPILIIRDIDLIKQMTIKDFDCFHDHTTLSANESDPFISKSLIVLNGLEWKQMRAILSPAFTSNKMKNMYQLISECAENFVGHFEGKKEQVAVEMKDIFSRFANDVIATTAFGIKVDSLKEPTNKFFTTGKKLFDIGIVTSFKLLLFEFFPKFAEKLQIKIFAKDVTNFFRVIIKDNIAKREKEGIVRPDMIHLLMEARKGQLSHENSEEGKEESFATAEDYHIGKNKNIEMTDDHIVAQAMLFFFAGFDQVSTISSFMAHELAVNPDIQKKLQEEIDDISQQSSGKISYETLLSMKYLDQVLCETLRIWPSGFQTDRICTKKYKILPKHAHEKTVEIDKGLSIVIPIMGIHRDPKYYHEPDRFDPERFNEENRINIVPGTYIPFGIGPRNCIGSRFALLEIKTLFLYLLSKFVIVPISGTEIPLRISPRKVNLAPKNGFRLGLKPRKK